MESCTIIQFQNNFIFYNFFLINFPTNCFNHVCKLNEPQHFKMAYTWAQRYCLIYLNIVLPCFTRASALTGFVVLHTKYSLQFLSSCQCNSSLAKQMLHLLYQQLSIIIIIIIVLVCL